MSVPVPFAARGGARKDSPSGERIPVIELVRLFSILVVIAVHLSDVRMCVVKRLGASPHNNASFMMFFDQSFGTRGPPAKTLVLARRCR